MSAYHYCAKCLASAVPSFQECQSCATPFTGAGSYDLLCGPPPSGEFAFLFDWRPGPRAGEGEAAAEVYRTTLLDLVVRTTEVTSDEDATVAAVFEQLRTGRARLTGSFRGTAVEAFDPGNAEEECPQRAVV
jgi:hypothetical protein